MATITIELAGKWVDGVGEDLHAAAKRGALSAAQRAVQEIVGRIIPARVPKPFDRGLFQAGWKAEKTDDGADIFNVEPHAVFIEGGVRASNVKAGRAMLNALAAWAERKGLVKKGSGMAAAWAISKVMKRRGIFRGGAGMQILDELVKSGRLEELLQEEIAREMGGGGP